MLHAVFHAEGQVLFIRILDELVSWGSFLIGHVDIIILFVEMGIKVNIVVRIGSLKKSGKYANNA